MLVVLGMAVAGCGGPDARLPGVYTDSAVEDDFTCGALLAAEGCVIVRFPKVRSGCEPEVPGYVVCNATITWTATSGAALPGSVLRVAVNGTEVEGCAPGPGFPCHVQGLSVFTHHFDGPGERHAWNHTVRAWLEVPGGVPETGGEFTLALTMQVRTEPRDAASL